ncbi:MAG: hypothetical protein AB8G22_10315 [Saprospiraceae bacterium]
MKKLLFILALLPYLLIAQTSPATENINYKNMLKYYEQATESNKNNDPVNADKRLKHAERYGGKLVKYGFKNDIQTELSKVNKLRQQIDNQLNSINSTTSSTSSHALQNTHDNSFTNKVEILENNLTQLERLFAVEVYYATVPAEVAQYMNQFNATEFAQLINEIKADIPQQRSVHGNVKSQLKTAEMYLKNPTITLRQRQVISRINNALAMAESPNVDMKKIVNNARQYLKILGQLYPNQAEIEQLKSKAEKALNRATTAASERLEVAKQRAADAKKVRIPATLETNPTLEKAFYQLAHPLAGNYTITKTILNSRGWAVQKNHIGNPTHRQRFGVVLYKDSAGNCSYQRHIYRQNVTVNGYGKIFIDESLPIQKIPCE